MVDSPYSPPPSTPYVPAGGPAAQDRTNVLAIVALVAAFFVPLAGIICGHIALVQIRRTGERGRGLALAGTILGYVFVALGLLIFVLAIAVAAASGAGSSIPTSLSS